MAQNPQVAGSNPVAMLSASRSSMDRAARRFTNFVTAFQIWVNAEKNTSAKKPVTSVPVKRHAVSGKHR